MLKSGTSFKFSLIPGLLILGLMVANILLVRQNFAMRRQLTARSEAVDPATKSLKVGEVVASIAGADLDGRPFELHYGDERKHLLFFLSPNCSYCVQQAPLWRDLLNKVDSSRVEVLGILSNQEDKKAAFTHAEELGYFKTATPLPLLFVSNESLARYRLMATPTTLLVSSSGMVEHV